MNRSSKIAAIILIGLISWLWYQANQPQDRDIFTTNIDLKNKTINDVASIDDGDPIPPIFDNLAYNGQKWLSSNFNLFQMYQNLANPASKYIVFNPGLRKEEVASILKKNLNWNSTDINAFLAMEKQTNKKNMEGYYTPGSYLIPATAKPADVYGIIMNKFNQDVRSRYATSTAEIIDMDTALKVASIIEREAAGTYDMRLISGVIWNRIFKDMNLEMDATLQYAKGNSKNGWWPAVLSKDKYINSPYNTYRNSGLPPTPISNVSIAAITAALNPKKTNCIFYLHDKHSGIHCAATYAQHLANIKRYYGK